MNDRQTELKEHSAHIFEMGCMEQHVYLKNDADAVIEAKDAEIAEIKQRYNDMDIAHTVHIAKMNAKIEELESNERRLKRALWLARAECCYRLDVDRYLRKHRNSWYNENCFTWNEACVAMEVKMRKAESKCRAKAEEFK